MSQQIGWSVEAKLLEQILKEIQKQTRVISTLTTTTTAA